MHHYWLRNFINDKNISILDVLYFFICAVIIGECLRFLINKMIKFFKTIIRAKRYKRLEEIMTHQRNLLNQEREELTKLNAATEELKVAITKSDMHLVNIFRKNWTEINETMNAIKLRYTALELERLKLKKKLA